MVLPELLLLDGGKGQLNIALQVLQGLGLDQALDVVGIAKDKNKEGEKLYIPGRKNPIILSQHSRVLLFLMRIRDEAHRYAVSSHRNIRKKTAFLSELDGIPGIGPSRKKALLAGIGSVSKIKKASVKTLSNIDGIGPDLATLIFEYFQEIEP
jgi:excinuclease ABC subunit C